MIPKPELNELCKLLNLEVASYTQAIKEHKDFVSVKNIYEKIKLLKSFIDVFAQEILS